MTVFVGPDSTGLATAFGIHVNAKQEIYQMPENVCRSATRLKISSVRAMLMKREDFNPKALRDPNLRERNSAAADVVSWHRRTLLEPLKTVRTEPFVIRRGDEPGLRILAPNEAQVRCGNAPDVEPELEK